MKSNALSLPKISRRLHFLLLCPIFGAFSFGTCSNPVSAEESSSVPKDTKPLTQVEFKDGTLLDIVYLKNGGMIKGKTREQDGKVYVYQPDSIVILEEDKVDRIDREAIQVKINKVENSGETSNPQSRFLWEHLSKANDKGLWFFLLGFGFALLAAGLLISALIQAFFVWMAGSFLGMEGGFGKALLASIFHWFFFVVFSWVANLFAAKVPPHLLFALPLLATVLAGTLAIRSAYGAGFLKSLATYFLSILLFILSTLGLLFIAKVTGPIPPH